MPKMRAYTSKALVSSTKPGSCWQQCFFLVDVKIRPPWQLFNFVTKGNKYRSKVSEKRFELILKTKSLANGCAFMVGMAFPTSEIPDMNVWSSFWVRDLAGKELCIASVLFAILHSSRVTGSVDVFLIHTEQSIGTHAFLKSCGIVTKASEISITIYSS